MGLYGERLALTLLCVFLLGLIWTGCSSTVKHDEPATTAPASATAAAPASETTTASAPPTAAPPAWQTTTAPPPASPSKYQAKYYFFDDVLVPRELEYDQEKSFVYETPQFKAGVLYFSKWNLDTDSVMTFFLYNMEKDGWTMVTSYRGKESHITFTKPDRGCTIRITSSWLGKAYVEIRVGPVGQKKN